MESPNRASNHNCTLDCLIQPPIAFVNRRLRQLSLSMLYGSNTFHFELDNFELSKGPLAREVKRCPSDWFRAVGTANLAMVRYLTLVGRMHESRGKYGGMMVTFVNGGDVQLEEVTGRGRCGGFENEWDDSEQKLKTRLVELQRDGLTVEGIEGVVGVLEIYDTRYLRNSGMTRDRR